MYERYTEIEVNEGKKKKKKLGMLIENSLATVSNNAKIPMDQWLVVIAVI